MPQTAGPLAGVRVIDAATLFAGPLCATMLGDMGADVIKVEHPNGDPVRTHGHAKDGIPLWWKVVSRNKRSITCNLSRQAGADLFRRVAATADIMVENFRPGTLERWGIGWEVLHALNPRLILVRVTGFGQQGPYADRPGFGTIAEAMSGFAHITGEPGGPPTLPPFGLADGICAMAATWAAVSALYHRDLRGGGGQMIDMAIYEPILTVLGPQPTVYQQLGVIQHRAGNRSGNNAPRNTYRTRDGRWVAISTSANSIAERVMAVVGRPDVIAEPWFKTGRSRAAHADELDAMVGGWIAQRTQEEVIQAFTAAEAAIAPIYDVSQVVTDPHFLARRSLLEVPDPDLGPLLMQNVIARFSETPAAIRWTGPALGAHNREIYEAELGLSPGELAARQEEGVI